MQRVTNSDLFLARLNKQRVNSLLPRGIAAPPPDAVRHALLRYVRMLKRVLSRCYNLIYLIIKLTHDRIADINSEVATTQVN
jgi:hypothetical protein